MSGIPKSASESEAQLVNSTAKGGVKSVESKGIMGFGNFEKVVR